MTESILTTWNDDRDGAFFGIAHALTADADLSSQIRRTLQDVTVAESWESMPCGAPSAHSGLSVTVYLCP